MYIQIQYTCNSFNTIIYPLPPLFFLSTRSILTIMFWLFGLLTLQDFFKLHVISFPIFVLLMKVIPEICNYSFILCTRTM